MKQPFWILNSFLFFLFFITLFFLFFAKSKLQKKQSIEPYEFPIEKKDLEKVNLEIIYKNDLFNTFQPLPIIETKETIDILPKAPEPVRAKIPELPPTQFFDPLPITLTGIISEEDENNNIAIILDNKTQQQVNYRVNDEIEDAQIVKILENKVILIRSNSQQEILYLNQQEAKKDSPIQKNIKNIVKKIDEDSYLIDPDKFINNINNLGEFIEALNLATAYNKGINIGSRVGQIEPESIGFYLGLRPSDIITKINDFDIDSTNKIFKVYKTIKSFKENDTIKVELLRNNKPTIFNYRLGKIQKAKPKTSMYGINQFEKKQEDKIEAEKIKILKEKNKFAPTIEELRLHEKQNFFKRKIDKK